MTIGPGRAWGRAVPRPPDLEIIHGDAEVALALSQRRECPVAVVSGDLARTLGVGPAGAGDVTRGTVNEFAVDLLEVSLDDGSPIIACAHVIARSPWYRAHWLRGPIVVVMNAEFIGEWDIAPRGHPNDGRAEVVEVDTSMSLRERLAARRRLATSTHVPHPRIATRSIRAGSWTFERPLDVIADGRRVGRASTLSVRVLPDAALVHA